MGKLQPVLVMLALSVLWKTGLGVPCSPSQYEVEGNCCAKCNPGFYVSSKCTELTNTTCDPCPDATYTDTLNGLEACRACAVCDSSGGLTVKRACISTSDTLCETLDGYYCTDPIKDGCQGAAEHTKCEPGQFILMQGTSSDDTVCANCTGSTYSDGSFLSCKPHTQCEVLGQQVVEEGTPLHDTVCGEVKRGNGLVIFGIIAAVIIFIVAFGCVYVICDRYNIRLCRIPRIFMR